MKCITKYKIYLKEFFARTLKVSHDDHTPILFEDYNESSYYYILNNNKNNIYCLDEVYTLFQKEKIIDPTTRLPVFRYDVVKIKFSR
uniref:Uncharacterized protein n=1 Tax=viral metagenome TaxID=1070528 RepID=A0A6C0D6C7_9ZZZZ